jgi:flagellar assembly factor FliW
MAAGPSQRYIVPEPDSGLPEKLFFTEGLAPFTNARRYNLYTDKEAPPLLRMECETTDLAYVLIDPFVVFPEYEPEFSDADFIDLKIEEDPLILAIVNLSRGVDHASMNLLGPLLINTRTGASRQALIQNPQAYTSRHRLFKEGA